MPSHRAQRPPRRAPAVAGFGLLELVIGLAVLTILASAAVQPAQQMLRARSVDQSVEGLVTALARARAEAMARAEVVTVCPRDPLAGDAAAVCANSLEWSAGWLVFVDRDRRGLLEPSDLLLQAIQPPPHAPRVIATMRRISFMPTGISLNAASHFDFVPEGGDPAAPDIVGARRACINKPGRLRMLPRALPCAGSA
ncbi:GspH/FimT family pseudopilin [Ideonella sp. 4Y16]|uniref:type II secretion system protein n=1 Tax=Ideonella alba TaxID=2824118 RepID=UPI001B3597E3|nr:GspH/FimT family pseudopilin [Ideonella alba]MBQ0943956.1 GspH/FimT family pseudopilin [Ideonella alba]